MTGVVRGVSIQLFGQIAPRWYTLMYTLDSKCTRRVLHLVQGVHFCSLWVTTFFHLTGYVCAKIGQKVCPATVSMTILFCLAYNGGYSGWVLSASPISKSLHHHLTFDISSECIKFNGYMTSSYRDICVKVTPQSIWIHCSSVTVCKNS